MNETLGNAALDVEETAKNRFLIFEIGGEFYGIEEHNMQEIITETKTIKVPENPEYVLGIINFRGEIITVVDLHIRVGKTQNNSGLKRCIIIANVNDYVVGLVADNIIGFVNIDNIKQKNIDMDFIKGSADIDGKSAILFDCEKLSL